MCDSRRIRFIILTLITLSLLLGLSACGRQSGEISQAGNADGSKLTVAVAIVPEATFVKAVGGERVKTITMIPPGYSPGNYSPSPGELTALEEASLYFSIGVPADLTAILPRVKAISPEIKIIKFQEEVARIYPDREFAPGKRDPHIWLSPLRAVVMVEIIARELVKLDPANEKTYRENARNYQGLLEELDRDIKNSLAGLKKRAFINYHPSLGYLAADYGLEMIAIEEEGKEATTRRLQEVIDRAGQEGIKTVFYQAEIDSRQSRAIASEIRGETVKLAPLAADYIDNMRKIVDQLVRSLAVAETEPETETEN